LQTTFSVIIQNLFTEAISMQFYLITRHTRFCLGKMERFKGIEEISPVLGAFICEVRKPATTFNTKQRLVEGDYAYQFSSAETADNF
jgi:hypothetical protein